MAETLSMKQTVLFAWSLYAVNGLFISLTGCGSGDGLPPPNPPSVATITTVAGTGVDGFNGDNQPATAAHLSEPLGVAVDRAGSLLMTDGRNFRVRRVDAQTGIITTVAGTRGRGFNGDNQPATSAQLNFPVGIAVDGAGNLLIADQTNARIRRVDAQTGIITTVAGTGVLGFNGDNQPATAAHMSDPWGVTVDRAGHLLIADHNNNRVRRVGP